MASSNDIFGHEYLALFRGREGKNNEAIMTLVSAERLTRYQIAKILRKKYSTIFDRLRDLERRDIVRAVAEVFGKTSKFPIPVYGLGYRGLGVAIFHPPDSKNGRELHKNALGICEHRIQEAWHFFSDLYDLDSFPSASRPLTKWVKSDNGVMAILTYFGEYGTAYNETELLSGFRRMVDDGIGRELSAHATASGVAKFYQIGSVWGSIESGAYPQPEIRTIEDALVNLATIAYQHPTLRKVYNAVKKADTPLYKRLRELSMKQKQVPARSRASMLIGSPSRIHDVEWST